MSWRLVDADGRDVGAYYPGQSPYSRVALSTFAGLGKRAWLVSWRGSPAYRLRPCCGLSTSSRIEICAVWKTGRLLRGNVSWSRPSKTADNWCRPSQDVDGPRYAAQSKSARCEPAWRLLSVATRQV